MAALTSPGAVLRRAWVFLAGQGLRLGVQTGYLVLFAAALGPQEYGRFTIAAAAAAIAGAVVGLGLNHAMVRQGAGNPAALPAALGRGEGAILLTGGTLAAALALGLPALFPDSGLATATVLAVAAGDLLCLRLSELHWLAFQARMEDRRAVAVQNLVVALKLAAAALLAVGWMPIAWWPWLYLGSGLLAVAAGRWWLAARIGRTWRPTLPARAAWKEGAGFSAGVAAQSLQGEIDKVLVGRLCPPEVAGCFGLAMKVVDAVHVPFRSLQHSAYARFFAIGREDPAGVWPYAAGIARVSIPLGVAVALALLAAGPLLGPRLAPAWSGLGAMIAALAWLPLLRCLATVALDGLWGAGRLRIRAVLPLTGALVSLGTALALQDRYGWWAAAAAGTAGTALVAVLASRALRATGQR